MENKKKNIGILGAFALSVGTSIGWGSFVVTGSNYLSKAGLPGSVIGIAVGALLMFVIAYCYHYMMNQTPDSGGLYSFVNHTFNGDHAFLASWYLLIVYIGILWANVTSVALFSRYLFGGIFQFGKLYSLAGYDIYLGEVLLCAGVLLLIGGLTFLNQRVTTGITFGLVAIFISAIIFVSLFSMIHQNGIPANDVTFAPEGEPFGQIMSVLAMTPWAFIGFESISHSAGSFSFKTKKALKILLVSLTVSAVLYILLCQISVMAQPEGYSSWYDYIANNTESGVMGIPPFYVAFHYMGQAGVVIFGITLFAIIATSIIGNIYASSNLLRRMAEDEIFPKRFAYTNKNDIPIYMRGFIIVITILAIFLGRSAIGFIVDVNNIGGVIVYAYVSACAFVTGRRSKALPAKIFGALGFIASLVFGVSHLVPVFTTSASFAQETFIVFVIFSLIGFAFFAFRLKKDTVGNFGNSPVVWIGISILVTFFAGVWIIERSKHIHSTLIDRIKDYFTSARLAYPDNAFLSEIEKSADRSNMTGMITLLVVIMSTLLILFFTLHFIKEHEKKHKMQLDRVSDMVNQDSLTGVKNHRAFFSNENRITMIVQSNPRYEYGIVVCDINDLKYMNDKFGHKFGDEYIRKACQMICRIYKMSPVFRTGGDEFVVIIEGEDYARRDELLASLKEMSVNNTKTEDGVVVAAGMAVKEKDENFQEVFRRADELMYVHKNKLKELRPTHVRR